MIRILAFAPLAALAACHQAPPPTRADAQIRSDCRQMVDREYSAQNRVDLTRRDERDTAYSGTYNAGIVSRGMGAQYQVDQMLTDCLRASGDAGGRSTPSVGPAFSPTEIGSGNSSLRP